MKLFNFLSLILTFSAALTFTACGNDAESTDATEMETTEMDASEMEADMDATGMHGKGEAYTSAYVCPMHCEGSGGDEPGNCPVCGMSYVAHDEHVDDGHTHMDDDGMMMDHDEDHHHDEHEGHDH